MGDAPSQAPNTRVDAQLAFATHSFNNQQDLIRFADTKAAAFITLLVFLGASSLPIAKESILKVRFSGYSEAMLSALYILTGGCFLLGFLWTLLLVYLVIKPRRATFSEPVERGHGLVFFGHVMLHASHEDYFQAIASANDRLLLRNITNQVFELAKICQEKMHYLNSARHPMTLAFGSWACNLVLGLWMLRWK